MAQRSGYDYVLFAAPPLNILLSHRNLEYDMGFSERL